MMEEDLKIEETEKEKEEVFLERKLLQQQLDSMFLDLFSSMLHYHVLMLGELQNLVYLALQILPDVWTLLLR